MVNFMLYELNLNFKSVEKKVSGEDFLPSRTRQTECL